MQETSPADEGGEGGTNGGGGENGGAPGQGFDVPGPHKSGLFWKLQRWVTWSALTCKSKWQKFEQCIYRTPDRSEKREGSSGWNWSR